jgi:NADP-dependent 3-hydroxy acid dehydrogenase YdfG
MGRAVALRAAAAGYAVAVSGRRADVLDAIVDEIREAGGTASAVPLDVTDTDAVPRARDAVNAALGPITDLVLSAGLNTPTRYWRDQTMTDFAAIVQTNLVGAAAVVDAVLPDLRRVGGGAIVFVSSYSGWRFSPDAGVAYSASKTAVSSLAETLNAQENINGVRACNLCPGDVDSDFLSLRPSVPGDDARRSMLSPDDVAAAVQFVLDGPPHVCINELVISPVKKGVER